MKIAAARQNEKIWFRTRPLKAAEICAVSGGFNR
jgi:hypothetical protein